jgi:hypothetical protein
MARAGSTGELRGTGFRSHPDENFSPLPGAGQLRGHALAEGFGAERPAEIGGARGRIGNHALQRVVDGGGRAQQRLVACAQRLLTFPMRTIPLTRH